ncbi:MAG: hypothetical protein OXD32_02550 [Endozoicomonadaceae bacterium]|nr:hypothetical protein [Endozoicomonadaceae bacterium]
MQQNSSSIEIAIKPSRYWLSFTVFGLLIAATACCHLSGMVLPLASLLLLSIYFSYILQRYYLLTLKSSIRGIRYRGNRWWIKRADNIWRLVTISAPPTVTAFLTVIPVQYPARYQPCFIALFADSVDNESYRRLRVLLRLQDQSN